MDSLIPVPSGAKEKLASLVVESPNYPGNYPNNLHKTFPITGPPGHVLVLTFKSLSIEVKPDFGFLSVQFREI